MKFEEIKKGMLISYDDNLYRITELAVDVLSETECVEFWVALTLDYEEKLKGHERFIYRHTMDRVSVFDIDAMVADQ